MGRWTGWLQLIISSSISLPSSYSPPPHDDSQWFKNKTTWLSFSHTHTDPPPSMSLSFSSSVTLSKAIRLARLNMWAGDGAADHMDENLINVKNSEKIPPKTSTKLILEKSVKPSEWNDKMLDVIRKLVGFSLGC